MFGLVRIIVRGELFGIKPNAIDKVLIAWLLVGSFLYVLVDGTHVPLSGRLGHAYTVAGIYVLVRAFVRTFDDIVFAVRLYAVLIVPLGVLFALERATGQNPFAVLGGVSLLSEIRDGRVRCQGPFLHSILAGTFSATAMSLFVGLCGYGKGNRLLATAAVVAATTIVITSASSGPLSAFAVSTAGLICWSYKHYMRPIRWGIVIGLLALDLVMNAPIWFLIQRLSDLTGGGGWYRSALIDAAVRHFDEWWLIGTGYTAHWMPTGITANVNSADLVNEFVAQGVSGGLLALLLFIWLIVKCFKTTGAAVHNTADYSLQQRFMIWAMGCGLLAHVASFFAVSYFDQMTIFWYLLIGMIAALVHETKEVFVDRSPIKVQRAPIRNRRFAHFHARSSAGFQVRPGKNAFLLHRR
jgi:hypothetical protein